MHKLCELILNLTRARIWCRLCGCERYGSGLNSCLKSLKTHNLGLCVLSFIDIILRSIKSEYSNSLILYKSLSVIIWFCQWWSIFRSFRMSWTCVHQLTLSMFHIGKVDFDFFTKLCTKFQSNILVLGLFWASNIFMARLGCRCPTVILFLQLTARYLYSSVGLIYSLQNSFVYWEKWSLNK